MKIVILGAGQVGVSMAEILSRENNDITLVDIDDAVLTGLQDRLDINTVHGSAAYPDVMEQAGVGDADLLLAVTDKDEVNMVACQIAWSLFKTPKKIARIRSYEYLSHPEIFDNASVPVDVIISPEALVTEQILRLIEHPGALQVVDFAGGKIRLVGLRAYSGSPLVGHPLRELRDHLPGIDTRVAAIYRQDSAIIPTGDTVIEPDDEVFFVAASADIFAVMNELRQADKAGRKIILAGAGNIGFRLAQALEKNNYQIKLIEFNEQRARYVAERLEKTVVLHGNAAAEELLQQANIENAEVFCALTNKDEANILSAMLAKRLGAHRVMSLVNSSAYVELVQSTMLDIALSPRLATIGTLLTHIRRGDVVQVASLRRGAAEAIEAVAHGDASTSRVVGRRVADIALPRGASLGAILRGEEVLIAHDITVIEPEDHVIVFVVDKADIPKIERLFQVAVTFI
ncbi:MAG: Trk system potassium transport protein TrkA [marine bacterium B5-7]|nr:MAG: Trk system potassium transport protein TrkA [marine bacterium B5-7]